MTIAAYTPSTGRRGCRAATLAVAALAAVAVLATATVEAQGRRGRFGGPHGAGLGPLGGFLAPGAVMRTMRALDVTDTQRDQIRAVFEQYRPQLQTAGTQLRESAAALRDAVTAEPFDEVAIRDRSAAVATAQTELAVLAGRVHSDVYNLLTPEQRQRAAELKAEREQRRQIRRERMRDRRQGR